MLSLADTERLANANWDGRGALTASIDRSNLKLSTIDGVSVSALIRRKDIELSEPDFVAQWLKPNLTQLFTEQSQKAA